MAANVARIFHSLQDVQQDVRSPGARAVARGRPPRRGQRSDSEPGHERPPGGERADQVDRPARRRPARRRPTRAAPPARSRTRRSRRSRAGQPDLPGARPGARSRAWPAPATRAYSACATQVVDELEYLGTLVERGVAGIIMVSGRHADHRRRPQRRTASCSPRASRWCSSTATRPRSPRHSSPATIDTPPPRRSRHLASLGHRRIAFVSGPARYVVVERKLAGYRRALASAGIDVDTTLVVDTVFSVEGGRAAAASVIERGATAVVAASDLMALGTILGAREHGLARACRVVRGRLRRHRPDGLHRPAADDGAPADRGHVRARHTAVARPARGGRPRSTASTCSVPSSSSAAPPPHAAKSRRIRDIGPCRHAAVRTSMGSRSS